MRRLAVLLVLAAGVLLSASRLPAPPVPAGTAAGLTALEKYLVDDVTFVGVANVKTVLAAPLHGKVKKEVAAVAEHEFFAKHLKQFGVKPAQDVERVVLIMGEQKARVENFKEKGPPENDERMYFLFQGKFDEKKFEAGFAQLAKDHPRAKLHGKGSTAILTFNNDHFFALVDHSAFIFAPSKKIIEEVQGRASGKIKAKFKLKDFPAALKSLKAEAAIDAVGFGPMQVDSKGERFGKDGYKITPITLDQIGFKKLTVQVEVKNDLQGKVVFEGKSKTGFAAIARKLTEGFEQEKKDLEKGAEHDPFEKAMLGFFKAVKITTGEQALTFEGALAQGDVKLLLELL
jgi:hypothetical protein